MSCLLLTSKRSDYSFQHFLCYFFVVWNIKMCELLNPQRTIKGSQLLQLHNSWIFPKMMPVIYIPIHYHNTGHQNAGGPSGTGLWDGISSPDSIINGKRFIQALLAVWAMGKVVPHLALKTEWSVFWTWRALPCLHTALRKNKTALMSRRILAEFILQPWRLQSSFACEHQLLVTCELDLWVGIFCLILQLLQSLFHSSLFYTAPVYSGLAL